MAIVLTLKQIKVLFKGFLNVFNEVLLNLGKIRLIYSNIPKKIKHEKMIMILY